MIISLIMPNYNTPEMTLGTVRSFLDCTEFHNMDYIRLLVIDNSDNDDKASKLEDGIYELLMHYKSYNLSYVPVVYKRMGENLGYVKGINYGIVLANKLCASDVFGFLNNDIIFSPDWLRSMTRVLMLDSKIGIVGPTTHFLDHNALGDKQARFELANGIFDYDKHLPSIYKFCRKYTNTRRDMVRMVDFVAFFFTLIKADVLKDVWGKFGHYGLDETFGTGLFDDDDFCDKARSCGYEIALDDELYVHHFGSTTFLSNKMPYDEIYEHNKEIYEKRKEEGLYK